MKSYVGKQTCIQSYKHDEQIHRVWKTTKVLSISNEHIVTAHRKSKVFEKNGRVWYTREPAVCYFFNNRWYNVIAMIKKDGIYYYCNISSPATVDAEAVKYIDYDLDVKFFPNGEYVILDKNEFNKNSKVMAYQRDLLDILPSQIDIVINDYKAKRYPFNNDMVFQDYDNYLKKGVDNENI